MHLSIYSSYYFFDTLHTDIISINIISISTVDRIDTHNTLSITIDVTITVAVGVDDWPMLLLVDS